MGSYAFLGYEKRIQLHMNNKIHMVNGVFKHYGLTVPLRSIFVAPGDCLI